MSSNKQQLHWTQRVALIRHNLHAASRSSDFTFFKTLQAEGLIECTNHVATLSNALGDEADTLLAAMDNLNAGLAYVHQDAFKNVYDNLKNLTREENKDVDRSKLHVDIIMQKTMADMAIDKMSSSVIALINLQAPIVQDMALNVWITGVSIIADALEVSLKQMDSLDSKIDDFIRLEEAWNTVKASVACAITGLKGVFSLMDTSTPGGSSDKSSTRSASIVSASSAMFRRLSTAFASSNGGITGPSPPSSRNASIVSAPSNISSFNRNNSVSSLNSNPVYRTPNYVRNSVSVGCPTSMPPGGDFKSHKLSMIPPTPAFDDVLDPFETEEPPIPPVPEIAAIQPALQPVGSLHQRRMSQRVN
jgi:hypothetical protein